MVVAPIPADEPSRLEALYRLELLDTAAEQRFDRLTELASIVVGVPIALISLIDSDRQWFKSRVGLDVSETGRDVSFCAHAIVAPSPSEPFVIEDALLDARFVDNPLVTGEPGVRFYAGQVLHDRDGHALGTLCAIDRRPRVLDATQQRGLAHIAELVEQELDRHADVRVLADLERKLSRSEQHAGVSLDALEQGVILVDRTMTINRINPAAKAILGYTAEELGRLWRSDQWITYHEDGSIVPPGERPFARAVLEGLPVVGQVIGWRRSDGARILIRLSCIPDADGAGSMVITFTDITADHLARRLLDATLETAPVGLAILDTDRSILRCNPEFANQAGRPARELIGVDVVSLLHHEHQPDAAAVGHQMREGSQSAARLEQRVIRPDGREVWVQTHLAVIPDPERPLAIAATFDVTEQRALMLELTRFGHLFEHANDIITIVDPAGHILYASPSNERIFGYPRHSRHPGGLLALVHPDDLAAAASELRSLVAGTRAPEPFTTRIRTASGQWRHVECVAVNLLDDPAVRGIVITARDVTERQQLTDELAHRAQHDSLTELPNRQLLDERLSQALARADRAGTSVGLCFIDLDGFKGVNDTLGHAAGDRLLVRVAERIRASIRTGDTAARIGGDEFVLVLDPITRSEQATLVAQRVRDAVLELNDDLPDHVQFGASIGLAISTFEETNERILQRADSALYRAKSTHDSSIRFASALNGSIG